MFVAAWIGLNLLAPQFGVAGLDPPPFTWLGLALSLVALYLMVLILTAQRRDDELAELREQLTLELALLSEQKTAKMIELLEEFRRDTRSWRTARTTRRMRWRSLPIRRASLRRCGKPQPKRRGSNAPRRRYEKRNIADV